MKLKLFILLFLGGIFLSNAQFIVEDEHGNQIHDGDIFEYGVIDPEVSTLNFFVTNTGTETIYSRVEYIEQNNAADSKFSELCYGFECYFMIDIGIRVPLINLEAVEIEPGGTTGMGNHFYSDDQGLDPGENVDFIFAFKLYEDATSENEIGQSLTFTYRYNPLLSVQEAKQVNMSVISTIVSERIEMDVKEPVQVQLYDYQGRLVKQASFETGKQELNVSDLSSQAYLLRIKNDGGAVKTTKIIKR